MSSANVPSFLVVLLVALMICGCHSSEAELAAQREQFLAQNSHQMIMRFLATSHKSAAIEFRAMSQAVHVKSSSDIEAQFKIKNLQRKKRAYRLSFTVEPKRLEKSLSLVEGRTLVLDGLESRELTLKFRLANLKAGAGVGNDYIKLTVNAMESPSEQASH